jgi:hypothetical protein
MLTKDANQKKRKFSSCVQKLKGPFSTPKTKQSLEQQSTMMIPYWKRLFGSNHCDSGSRGGGNLEVMQIHRSMKGIYLVIKDENRQKIRQKHVPEVLESNSMSILVHCGSFSSEFRQ